ncbi:GNAT family N-acetyltransferase [Magnetococcus sp. PR-3]|uniref:GNAT family N-acetyltransferase n=1 Tax=Magnetococcus sp. PR-3 TaxID=3120355 RepID=UPI002FCE63C5
MTHIRLANRSDQPTIIDLVAQLLDEIMQRSGGKHFDMDRKQSLSLLEEWLKDGSYSVLIAEQAQEIVGCATMVESRSLYAGGSFLSVPELYVVPALRSHGVGKLLLDAVIAHAQANRWDRIELTTPPLPMFDKTVAFYKQNGFERAGGYKMKRIIQKPI